MLSLAEQHKPKEEVEEKESVFGSFAKKVRAWEAEPPWVEPPKGEELSSEEGNGEEEAPGNRE